MALGGNEYNGYVRFLLAQSVVNSVTFAAQLAVEESALWANRNEGQISVTAGRGYSTQYASGSGFSLALMCEAISKATGEHATSRSDLVARGVTSPTDQQISDEMTLREGEGSREVRGHFGGMQR
mgnify:CR=1 FL=1|tara:strand:- start:744 stop:1118 length:375 start_codon:yes stop_codon:yes gene_type:complete